MASVKSNNAAVMQQARKQVINALDRVGQQGKITAEDLTWRDTGFAADSVHYVVLDEQGNVVAGQQIDGNGNSVPDYPADGTIRVIVGSNTEPKDSKGYYKFIEEGTYGLSGAGAMAQGLDVMEAAIEQEFRR